jgi:hypothetical protein
MRSEDVSEHFNDDQKRERIFNGHGKPIGVKVIAAIRRRIENDGQHDSAGDVKNDVEEKI